VPVTVSTPGAAAASDIAFQMIMIMIMIMIRDKGIKLAAEKLGLG
jgi:hypothetical protein